VTITRTGRLFMAGAVAILAASLAGTSRAAVQVDASILVEPAARVSGAGIDVWTNKEEGGVYRQGEPMRVSFRTSTDAFVLIYNIDTEGYIHLVYPYGPEDDDRIEGGVTYQVPSRDDPYEMVADGPTGVEYIVAIASPVPFRDLPWFLRGRYEGEAGDYGQDDEDSGVIVGDPYVGMDRVIRRVVPPGLEDEVATDDTYFYIERRVEYPRYVCADCHSYGGWYDPYGDICTVVDIRIDGAWARYRPFRSRIIRPRYFYMVRSTAPSRYRQWKDRWSSVDGRTTLRTRFRVDGQDKFRSRREMQQRRTPPEFQNLRRPRSGRVWRAPDEVLRRDRQNQDQRVRERANERPDRTTLQRERETRNRDERQRDEVRGRDETRRREWQNRQEQRRNEQRQMQERRRNEQRQTQERRRSEDRQIRERRDEGRRQEAARERRDDNRREERANRDRGRNRSEERDRGDRGRGNDDRRRDDGDRGSRGRGNDRGR
jgi:hypothetical protein